MGCLLCEEEGGTLLWRDDFCRIVRIPGADYPGLCRVVLNRHAVEMTDLGEDERARLMRAVFATERVLRDLFRPDKMNLASFGNKVQHLHWHVIPRTTDDPHFPEPSWGAPQRPAPPPRPAVRDEEIADRLAETLNQPSRT